MSRNVVAGLLPLVFVGSALAQAACPCGSGTLVTSTTGLATLLGNNMVCAAVGGDAWQEYHSGTTIAGGPLIDYKRGPGDPVDPQQTVGSWAVVPSSANQSRAAIVNYSYTGGQTYGYNVCLVQAGASSSTVNFCASSGNSRNVPGATLLASAGPVSCGALIGQNAKSAR